MARKWYAMNVGHVLGVYDEWPECQAQVYPFSGGSQRGFDTRGEAKASYLRFTLERERDQNRCLMSYYYRIESMSRGGVIRLLDQ